MSLPFPEIDPVLFSLGPLAVRWYALAYMTGFLGGWWQCMKLAAASASGPKPKDYDDYLVWAVVGTVLGGRLGYVLFYQFEWYLQNPLDALMIWHGGMSFHGGMLGVVLAALLFVRRRGLSFWAFTDLLAVVAPIGLFFGRLANFINGELFGRVTDAPWGVVFPQGGALPRHPSQLYEAALEGFVLYVILTLLSRKAWVRDKRGLLSGLFLALYALFRFVVEFFREPDEQLGFLFAGATMGQLLCVPMFLFGAFVISRSFKTKVAP